MSEIEEIEMLIKDFPKGVTISFVDGWFVAKKKGRRGHTMRKSFADAIRQEHSILELSGNVDVGNPNNKGFV